MIEWRNIQRQNFTCWKELSAFLQLEKQYFPQIITSSFPLNLPIRLAGKIEKEKWDDPILKQFLPIIQEREITTGFLNDPVADATFQKEKKLLQKYEGRALLVTTGACAMNCRFCFRQNFSYETEEKGYEAELEIIRKDSSLREIILSGGDPLSLSNATLQYLIENLNEIPHLKRLRFHTRFPIGIPERIDQGFLTLLSSSRLQVFFVIHCNHPKELDEDIFAAIGKIQKLGIPVLNHTVLLKGINDQIDVMKQLCETLVDRAILPYYLNQLDRLQGSAHFEVSEKVGVNLVENLRHQLSGYAVPRYVKEIPNRLSKTPIL